MTTGRRWAGVVIASWAALVAASAMGCAGESALGEECGEVGVADGECEEGAICAVQKTGETLCLRICVAQTDCAADEECNGVEGTNVKACRKA